MNNKASENNRLLRKKRLRGVFSVGFFLIGAGFFVNAGVVEFLASNYLFAFICGFLGLVMTLIGGRAVDVILTAREDAGGPGETGEF